MVEQKRWSKRSKRENEEANTKGGEGGNRSEVVCHSAIVRLATGVV